MTDTLSSFSELLETMRQQRDNAQLALFVGAQLEEAGRIDEAVALWSLGDDINPAVRRVKDDPGGHHVMRSHSRRADAAISRFFTDLHTNAIDDFAKNVDGDVGRVRNAIWSMTHAEPFDFLTPMQEPVIFYMPDLPAVPVWKRDQLSWSSEIEAGFQDILEEYHAASNDSKFMEPYVPEDMSGEEWQKLSGTLDWTAIYLFKEAEAMPAVGSFPKTRALLNEIDLVRVNGVPMEAFFSKLKPGAHIPPHYGLTNTRLTVHLPLIVPDACAIRVGQDEHGWCEGEITAFDDSFEHEAWNKSDTDRVVLIFEVHHPDLSDAERRAIEHSYSVRRDWLESRSKILGWN